MNSNDIANKINQYRNILNKVISVKNNMSLSIQCLDNITELQDKCYKKDDECASGSYLNTLREKESKVLSNIENNVIPNINRKLNSLSNQYKDLKIKEQLESEVNING